MLFSYPPFNSISSFLDPCGSHPCQNGGTCIQQGLDGYQCLCPIGFEGDVNCGMCGFFCTSTQSYSNSKYLGYVCFIMGKKGEGRRHITHTHILLLMTLDFCPPYTTFFLLQCCSYNFFLKKNFSKSW